jgi:hypothetical protein
MFLAFALAGAMAAMSPDTLPTPVAAPSADTTAVLTAAPAAGPLAPQPAGVRGTAADVAPDDTTPARRRKAFEISDAYATRLKIHYIASYATLPIFAAQAIVGEQLYNKYTTGQIVTRSLLNTHQDIAWGLGALFLTNTVTGSMNWWETRHQETGRTWRTIHGALMLLADAGFAYTASLGERVHVGEARPDLHRNMAETSAGVALVSYAMMWKIFRKD